MKMMCVGSGCVYDEQKKINGCGVQDMYTVIGWEDENDGWVGAGCVGWAEENKWVWVGAGCVG